MSEPEEGPGTPLLGRQRAGPAAGYRRVVGAHRAPGTGGPPRGYLFTVALLAGTASMPILAAFSAGSATVGNSAFPDSSTRFIPTPSVGPVVVPLPNRAAATSPPPAARLLPAAPALPGDTDLGSQRRSLPGTSAPRPVPRPTRAAAPTTPPCPSPVPSPSASTPATPDPTASPTAEPTSTFSDPAIDPSPTASADPTRSPSPAGSPPPTSPSPEESPTPTRSPSADPDPSPTVGPSPSDRSAGPA
ncbi:hypothetical protein Q2K19_10505 [Micromonospora soli]|uniref:hypothetical protein n=1 Tax=Micromonospora sp. NBRC 110009 TaxID=3061627 RepID=UPI0026713F74|nr:hypothetical protein [Micromonospora sp. NBRC 110009]WKU00869.1 hypothetical protein Q2K19_10505 [Micromonospora sp. NBRC 110009]